MTVFDDMLADLFGDPDMGIDAVHWPAGARAGDTVRLVLSSDRSEFPVGAGRIVAERVTGQVRAAELPAIAKGDWLQAGGVWYRIDANPERDAAGLWQLGLQRSEAAP